MKTYTRRHNFVTSGTSLLIMRGIDPSRARFAAMKKAADWPTEKDLDGTPLVVAESETAFLDALLKPYLRDSSWQTDEDEDISFREVEKPIPTLEQLAATAAAVEASGDYVPPVASAASANSFTSQNRDFALAIKPTIPLSTAPAPIRPVQKGATGTGVLPPILHRTPGARASIAASADAAMRAAIAKATTPAAKSHHVARIIKRGP